MLRFSVKPESWSSGPLDKTFGVPAASSSPSTEPGGRETADAGRGRCAGLCMPLPSGGGLPTMPTRWVTFYTDGWWGRGLFGRINGFSLPVGSPVLPKPSVAELH